MSRKTLVGSKAEGNSNSHLQQQHAATSSLQIVDQHEYQQNCDKIIEANANLQDAINLTSRSPITPVTMGNIQTGNNFGPPLTTNEHSSCQSFYKLDESIYRAGGYAAMATGTQQIKGSREGSQSREISTIHGLDAKVAVVGSNQQCQRANLAVSQSETPSVHASNLYGVSVAQTPNYHGGVQVKKNSALLVLSSSQQCSVPIDTHPVNPSNASAIANLVDKEEKAIDAFLDQLDFGKNADVLV